MLLSGRFMISLVLLFNPSEDLWILRSNLNCGINHTRWASKVTNYICRSDLSTNRIARMNFNSIP